MGTGDCAQPSHGSQNPVPCLPSLTVTSSTLQSLRPRIQLTAIFGSTMVMLSVLTRFLSCPNLDTYPSASQPDWDLLDGSGPACRAGDSSCHPFVHEPRISCLLMGFIKFSLSVLDTAL